MPDARGIRDHECRFPPRDVRSARAQAAAVLGQRAGTVGGLLLPAAPARPLLLVLASAPVASAARAAFAAWEAVAAAGMSLPPLVRECAVCGLRVDLAAVALERLLDQALHPSPAASRPALRQCPGSARGVLR